MFYLYQVLIGRRVSSLNKTFSYYYEDDSLKRGMRVLVDFGNSKNVLSLVFSTAEKIDMTTEEYQKKYQIKLSKIKSKADKYPLMTDTQLQLINEVSNYYKVNLMSVIDSVLPPALKTSKNAFDKPTKAGKVTYIRLSDNCDYSLSINEKKFIDKLREKRELKLSEVTCKKTLQNLLLKGVVIKEEKEYSEVSKLEINKLINFELSYDQKQCYDYITNCSKKTILLHGVTGSGKTAIYIKLIDKILKEGKQALVMIPEISLTSQLFSIFSSHYKEQLAILNSSLSSGKRYETYLEILQGRKNVVLGTRLSVFSPLEKLGLIIIDEEHSTSYKQDRVPFYDSRTVASFLAKITSCKIVLGSATPSLLSMAKAKKEVYGYTRLSSQYSGLSNREIKIVDLNESRNFDAHSSSIISNTLKEEINERLKRKEQVLLLINRRGYAPMMQCDNCFSVARCPNCDVPLIYHRRMDLLKCHHCGYQENKESYTCTCGKKEFSLYGFGTERIDTEIRYLFPDAKIAHVDSDSGSKKTREEAIYLFSKGYIDILIGTQIISKGHDFSNVTLAGIIDVDNLLSLPTYMSNEETFSLISQFVGRAGRGKKKATVIIQTAIKDNPIIKFALNQDYDHFYDYEMEQRRRCKTPPYTSMTMITVRSYDEKLTIEQVQQYRDYLSKRAIDLKVDIIGPITPYIPYINNKYSRQILIKYKYYSDVSPILDEIVIIKDNDRRKDYELLINVDCISEI